MSYNPIFKWNFSKHTQPEHAAKREDGKRGFGESQEVPRDPAGGARNQTDEGGQVTGCRETQDQLSLSRVRFLLARFAR